MFTVTIHTEGDAFVPGPGEVQRILAEIIRMLTDDALAGDKPYTKYRTILDINGNSVGTWKYAPDESVPAPKPARRRRRDGRSMMPRAFGA